MSQLPDQRTSPPFYAWVYPLIVALTTFFVFGQLIMADFLGWDEQFNIWQNPDFNPPTLGKIAFYWTNAAYGLYIPLAYTVWGAIAFIARVSPDPRGVSLNPSIYHFANILLHVISALVVYAILLRLFDRNHRAACFGALLFAIHPLQIEPVGWTAGLKDVMSGMFSLIAIWQYLVSAQEERSRAERYAIATSALVLAMLSKPSAMMTPAIVFVIDWLLVQRPLKRIWPWLGPWIGLAIVCAIIARIVQPAIGVESAPIQDRPFVIGDALTFYLGKFIWPIHLAPEYGHRPQAVMSSWWFYVSWIVPAAIGVMLLSLRKRFPQLLVAGLIFVLAPLPVLGFVTFLFQHFSTTADHYLYLAMFGPALAVAWLISRYRQGAVVLIVALWLSLLGIRSFLQSRYWQNDVTIWTHTIDVNPHSFMSMSNLGVYLLSEGNVQAAQQYFEAAIQEFNGYVQAYDNLALAFEQQKEWEQAVTTRQMGLRKQLERRPKEIIGDLVPPLFKLAYDQIQLQHFNEARACLNQAENFDPHRPEVLQMEQYLNDEMKRAAATNPTSPPTQ